MKKAFLVLFSSWIAFVGCAQNNGASLPMITPTLYYKPVIEKSKMKCDAADMRDVLDESGNVITHLCLKDFDHCVMQGSCFVIENNRTLALNIMKKKDGVHRFAERREDRCPYGYGVRAICMDPFYSIAADPAFYKPGDVIFIPKLVGLELPDGTKHNGYMIVRDEGARIIGEGRFDFFTGFYGPYDKRNSFARMGLSDKKNKFGYQIMPEAIAKKVREFRNYPNIPTDFYDKNIY